MDFSSKTIEDFSKLSEKDWLNFVLDVSNKRKAKEDEEEVRKAKETDAFKKLEKKMLEHKDELVLCHFDVFKLCGVDADRDDAYWVFNNLQNNVWHSCVSGWIPLKTYLPTEDYEHLVYIWNNNSESKAK